jgi:uncharacterized protein YlxP (DUF503 family)
LLTEDGPSLLERGIMQILALEITLRCAWCESLKDKRSVVKSLLAKLQNKFHVSCAEIARQDARQTIVIGVAAIVPGSAQADAVAARIVSFVEANAEAEITEIVRELR